MVCNGSFITSHFFWAIPAGLFTGFALSRLLRFHRRSDIRARHWKWIMFSFYLSMAVVLALCAAFIPSSFCSDPPGLRVSRNFLDLRILAMAAGSAVAGLLGLRFKRSAGLPLLFLLALGLSAIPVVRYPWRHYDTAVPLAEFRLLSITSGGRSIEFTPHSGDTYFVEMTGTGIAVNLDVLSTSDYYFFADKPLMYRLRSISPAGNEEISYSLAENAGKAGKNVQAWIQQKMQNLPGWEVYSISAQTERLLPLFRYAVYLNEESRPEIRLMQPQG